MSIHIKQVSVKNLGPIPDFDQQMKQVNLFYGHNETGKTYLVEFIYRSLFKHLNLNLRDNHASGQVIVSGMDTKDISFSPSKNLKKLEDFWGEDLPGLPADFSRLLVVKGADLDLASCVQGIDTKVLKEFLSGEGLLDSIGDRINPTERSAEYKDGIILGPNRGLIKEYNQLKEMIDRFDQNIREVEVQISGGRRAELAERISFLVEEKEALEQAKQHLAYKLSEEIAVLKAQWQALSQEQISDLDKMVYEHQSNTTNLEEKVAALKENQKKSRHFNWLEKAADQYERLVFMEKNQRKQSGLVWLILSIVSLIAAIILNIMNQPTIGIGAIVLAIFFGAAHLYMRNRIPVSDFQKQEMEKIEEDYRERFDEPGKVGSATLSSKKEELQEYRSKAEILSGDVEKIKSDLKTLEVEINHLLGKFPHVKVKEGVWQEAVNQLQKERDSLDADLRSKENALSRLNIPESDFRMKPVKIPFDSDRYLDLLNNLQEKKEELDGVEGALRELKQAVCGLTGEKIEIPWEQLIEKLHQKRADTVNEYKQVTAELIARITVNQALDELREHETRRIDDGLRSTEVNQALLSTTGHYNQVELENGELVLSDKYGRYPLSDLSTGAREQVLLGLRLGFASRLLTGKPLFLILDDAFQHSDWERRQGLVEKLFSLAEEGWQVLYFTMDDHIRALFEKAGKKIGKGQYQTIEMQR